MAEAAYSTTVETARTYYNSNDADSFYAAIWGGEDIHIGIYQQPEGDSIFEASHRSVEKLASLLTLTDSSRVLDIGAGYGGTARYLAKIYGCHVDCLNLSEIQNQRNRDLNQAQALSDKIQVIDGSFEAIPTPAAQYDVVCSQDAILHSGNRRLVLEEVARVLKSGGVFVFTDPMQSDDCPPQVLQPVLDRIHLDSLGSIGFYTEQLNTLGFERTQVIEMTEQLINHYSHVRQEITQRYDELLKQCSKAYIDRMKIGLGHWIDAGKNGYLRWGFLRFRKQ